MDWLKRTRKRVDSVMNKKMPLFTFVLSIFIALVWGSVSAGKEVRPGLSGQEALEVQRIETLSVSPKLSEPQAILRFFLEGDSTTRVIVNLKKAASIQGEENLRDMEYRRRLVETVKGVLDRVTGSLDPAGVRITNQFRYFPGFSAEVSLDGLEDLVNNPEVLSIDKDHIRYAQTAQGIPLMKASTVRNTYNGSGMAIAICDTGIDYTHPKLGGDGFPNTKVIGGYDCGDDDSDPMDGQGHGTACAGIAAGDLGTTGDYIGGVAYNAKLYAVKIAYGTGGSAYDSDMIEGWEWCITHQNDDPNHPIMVISTSFGGGRYLSTCDSESSAMTNAAKNAVAAGMTLFVSSGNDGYCDAIEWPACISYVNSVGAVYDATLGQNPPPGYVGCISNDSCTGNTEPHYCNEKWYVDDPANADQVTTYSNSASFLGLFAPSNWAYTCKMGGGYWDTANGFGGTSAACPYAAGAAACLQSAAMAIKGSYLTPAEVESTLANTGDSIMDGKVAITKPRINLQEAINSLRHSGPAIPIPGVLFLLLTSADGPNIAYFGANPYDYGIVQPGSSRDHPFTIRNTGSAPPADPDCRRRGAGEDPRGRSADERTHPQRPGKGL